MENACPKCGAPKTSESCPKCGLVFARYNPEIMEEPPPGLLELFEYVEQHWDEVSAHAVFIERAFFLGHPDFAARRYRQKGDDPTAKTQLTRIVARVEQTLLASKTEPLPPKRPSRTVLLAALFILAAGAAALFAMYMQR